MTARRGFAGRLVDILRSGRQPGQRREVVHDGVTLPLASALAAYRALLGAFVAEEITDAAFQARFFHLYLRDPARWPSDVFEVLDTFFAEVDAYSDAPELSRGVVSGNVGELRRRAVGVLERLDHIEPAPAGSSVAGPVPTPARLTHEQAVGELAIGALCGRVPLHDVVWHAQQVAGVTDSLAEVTRRLAADLVDRDLMHPGDLRDHEVVPWSGTSAQVAERVVAQCEGLGWRTVGLGCWFAGTTTGTRYATDLLDRKLEEILRARAG